LTSTRTSSRTTSRRYPPSPLFGKRSEWSKERPTTVETLIAAMNEAGVGKAAVVHSSTTYGFDNSYVVDGCNKYPERLAAVGSVDVLQPDAPERIREWVGRGLAGLRLFTGGSTKEFDPSELDDPLLPGLGLCAELGIPDVHPDRPGRPAPGDRTGQALPEREHHPRPPGPPGRARRCAIQANAQSLFDLAPLKNIYLKLTPRIFGDVKKGDAAAASFFPRSWNLRRRTPGLGFELPDLAGHAGRDPGDRPGRPGQPERRRARVDLQQDRATAVPGTGSEILMFPGAMACKRVPCAGMLQAASQKREKSWRQVT
jgi:L-fuconolactonase